MEDSTFIQTSIASSTINPLYALPYYREYSLAMQVLSPMCLIILFGLVANIINITVFLKAGAADNVTILLLSLSVSDLAFLVLITPSIVGLLVLNLSSSNRHPFDITSPFVVTYWPAFTAYDISTFISVSLGVMRCACVAMPLKFKFVFTKSRTIKWVMFLVVLAIALRCPILSVYRFAWRKDPAMKTTEVYVKQVNRESMSNMNDIINRGVLVYMNYITMVTCVIILTYKLYQASKIRRSCKAPSASDQTSNKPDERGLSSKDLQVVKSVVLVCTIFILSQLMFLFISSIRLIHPQFDAGGNFGFFIGMLEQISNTCSYLNASVNIFVYFNYNSKFRAVFNSIFCKSREGESSG